MGKCLLCTREISNELSFHRLFLLGKKSFQPPLCPRCLKDFPKITWTHCPTCFQEGSAEVCEDCRHWERAGKIVRHQAIFQYREGMKDYFSRYKFMGDYQMRQAFAMSFRAIPKGYQRVPIPLSPERFQARGFNQVTGFLEAATISYDDVLEKVEVIKQSSLSRQERLKSENPFRLKKGVVLSKRVCVIDDIYTTGATLQHAMTVLKNAGVTDVCSFSLCR